MTVFIDTTETQRINLQTILDAQKSLLTRNQFGQFATPTFLAQAIVDHALAFVPDDQPITFLDPAFGTGSFYSAIQNHQHSRQINRAVGIELDPHYAMPATRLWASTPLELYTEDFLNLSSSLRTHEQFNFIVCNPPYVRHQHLKTADKLRYQQDTTSVFGKRISGLAGLYCYFLAYAHRWMAPNAIAAWLLPSEFMSVNYGDTIKHYLSEKVRLLHIHRFNPEHGQFSDALVASTVLFFQNAPPSSHHDIKFTNGGSLGDPEMTTVISNQALRQERKWTRFPHAGLQMPSNAPTLDDFFQIKRGIATGDNQFFILTPEQISSKNLPWKFFRPILPSPRYMAEDEIFADDDGNPTNTESLFVLDCREAETTIQEQYPELWMYLQMGIPAVSSRYLCSKRKLWYRQEQRLVPSFICTYLGRQTNKKASPFRFILNHSQALATNVYLLLYPRPELSNAIEQNPALKRMVWSILTAIDPDAFLREGRIYGGGLHKMEPRELGRVAVPQLSSLMATINR